jgi:hypothetical protein
MVSFEEIPEKKEIPEKEADDDVDLDVDDSWKELMGKDLIMKVRAVHIVQCIS